MSDIDPLTGTTGDLQSALAGRTSTTNPVASIEIAADGTIQAIHLTDLGRRTAPDALVFQIAQLHARALADLRGSVADVVNRIENDPRLRAQRDSTIDRLNQPLPLPARQPPPQPEQQSASHPTAAPWPPQTTTTPQPSAPPRSRQPTPEEEEEMDRYYREQNWFS